MGGEMEGDDTIVVFFVMNVIWVVKQKVMLSLLGGWGEGFNKWSLNLFFDSHWLRKSKFVNFFTNVG